MTVASFWQVPGAIDSVMHSAGSVSVSVHVVIVLSEKVPFAIAVQVPVTCKVPGTWPAGLVRPNSDRTSFEPVTLRQPDAFHVPVTVPPQAVTLAGGVQLPPCVPPLDVPPLPT